MKKRKKTSQKPKAEKHPLIVKRKGHAESFDEKKLYGSVYAACSISGMNEKRCEMVASDINKKVKGWLKGKRKIESHRIMKKAAEELKKKSHEAAYMYETHRDIS